MAEMNEMNVNKIEQAIEYLSRMKAKAERNKNSKRTGMTDEEKHNLEVKYESLCTAIEVLSLEGSKG